jgi:hypothetical protein
MIQILMIVAGMLLCIAGANGIIKRSFKVSTRRPVGGSGVIFLNLFTLLFGLSATIYALVYLPK